MVTPRKEPKLRENAPPGSSELLQTGNRVPDQVKVAPPSVDFQRPTGGSLDSARIRHRTVPIAEDAPSRADVKGVPIDHNGGDRATVRMLARCTDR